MTPAPHRLPEAGYSPAQGHSSTRDGTGWERKSAVQAPSGSRVPAGAVLTAVDGAPRSFQDAGLLPSAAQLPRPASGRQRARILMHRWRVTGRAASDTELALSELVANAVLHAAAPIRAWMARALGSVHSAVCDASPRAPTRPRPTTRSGTCRSFKQSPSVGESAVTAAASASGAPSPPPESASASTASGGLAAASRPTARSRARKSICPSASAFRTVSQRPAMSGFDPRLRVRRPASRAPGLLAPPLRGPGTPVSSSP